jgi:hypothetical protein
LMPRKLDHWLLAYQQYTEGTESPATYHLWSGLATLAAAAQRKIRLRVERLKIHSNLMVVLVGPSGGPRKTTALDMARSLLKDSEPDAIDVESYGQKIELAPEKASGAAIIRRLASIANRDHQSLSAYLGELGTLLGDKDKDMVDTITNFWDCRTDFEKDTIGRGAESITAPWLNILAATTPVWLADNLAATAMEGGLVSRGLWVYEAEKTRRVADPPEPPQQLRYDLVHDLAEIMKLSGWAHLTPEAHARYKHWYEVELDQERLPDARFASHRERKHVNVLKVALLISIAQDDSLEVQLGDFENALAYVGELEEGMSAAFQGVGKNLHSMDYERIKAQIKRAQGPVHYREIIQRNVHSIDKEIIDRILITLAQAGEIRREGQLFLDAA